MLTDEVIIGVSIVFAFVTFFFGVFLGWRIDVRIKEHKQKVLTEIELNKIERKLNELRKQQITLLSNVSHELKTPLSAITVLVDNLRDGIIPWNEENADIILDYCDNLAELVTFMLDLSKIDNGEKGLKISNVSVNDWIWKNIDKLELFNDHNAQIKVNVLSEDLTAQFDEKRMNQVLTNLLINALTHTTDGGVISIKAFEKSDKFFFYVYNEGRRLNQNNENVFTRFTTDNANFMSFHHKNNKITSGSGLGLDIVRWIVSLHLGTVKTVNPENYGENPNGTMFLVQL